MHKFCTSNEKRISDRTGGNKHYEITYGVDDQRCKSEYKVNNQTQLTRYYLGDYEEEVDANGYLRQIHYLSGGAVMIIKSGVETLYYGYADFQGSLIALTRRGYPTGREFACTMV